MADYFEEMSIEPLGEGEVPNHRAQFFVFVNQFVMPGQMVETGINWHPPAAKDVVANLPTVEVKIKGHKCAVCLKQFKKNELAVLLPCKHFFHSDCISPWLAKTNSCPVCRHELKTDDVAYEEFKKQKLRAKQREEGIEVLHNSMFS